MNKIGGIKYFLNFLKFSLQIFDSSFFKQFIIKPLHNNWIKQVKKINIKIYFKLNNDFEFETLN